MTQENTENFDDGLTQVAPKGQFKAEESPLSSKIIRNKKNVRVTIDELGIIKTEDVAQAVARLKFGIREFNKDRINGDMLECSENDVENMIDKIMGDFSK